MTPATVHTRPGTHRSRFSKEALMFDATTPMGTMHSQARHRAKPAEYRIYYAIVFAVALPITLVSRLLPRERSFLDRGERRGVLGEARALTDTVIPYLFMG